MNVYSVLAIAATATASAQAEELGDERHEFELAEAPFAPPDAPWAHEAEELPEDSALIEN